MTLPSLIEAGRATLRKKYAVFPVEGEHSQFTEGIFISDVETLEAFLTDHTERVWNAALESAVGALPKARNAMEGQMELEDYCENSGYNQSLLNVRTALLDLQKKVWN